MAVFPDTSDKPHLYIMSSKISLLIPGQNMCHNLWGETQCTTLGGELTMLVFTVCRTTSLGMTMVHITYDV